MTDKLAMRLDAFNASRLELLKNTTTDRWIALSADESRVIAEGETFAEVVAALEQSGEDDPLIIRVPEDWTARSL